MIYIAHYRYRDKENSLNDTGIEIESKNFKDAKLVAKNMEGQDNKTWLIEVFRKEDIT